MNKTSKHLQYSVLTGLVALFGITIGFAGAANGTLPGAVYSFVLSSPNDVVDGPFAGARFDIAGLMSHPCYTIAGTEAAHCNAEYGIQEPLMNFVENGMVLSFASSRGLLAGQTVVPQNKDTSITIDTNTAPVVTAVTEETQSTVTMTLAPGVTTLDSTVDTEADFAALRLTRSNLLWNMCIRKDATRREASLCFQQNIHLLSRLDVEINEETIQ